MKKQFLIYTFLLSICAITSKGNLDSLKEKCYDVCINAELKYNYRKSSGIEAGINITRFANNTSLDVIEYGTYLSCEYPFLYKKNTLSPKLGFGFTHLIYKLKGFGYCAKLNIIVYDPGHCNDLRLLPEVGFSYLGVINITYGYTLALTENNVSEIPDHVIAVGFNFSRKRGIITVFSLLPSW